MSKPLDFFGNEINVGDKVVYVGAGYTEFLTEVVTKISAKTVTLGDRTQWGSHIRRAFDRIIVVKEVK